MAVQQWVNERVGSFSPLAAVGSLGQLKVAIHQLGEDPTQLSHAVAELTLGVVCGGGSVVMPSSSTLLKVPHFKETIVGSPNDNDGQNPTAPPLEQFVASLPFGGTLHGVTPGLHVMEMPTRNIDWVETLTGIASAGVHVIVVIATRSELNAQRRQAHPFLPTLFLCVDEGSEGSCEDAGATLGADDVFYAEEPVAACSTRLMKMLSEVVSRRYTPINNQINNTDFQITRGHSGISL